MKKNNETEPSLSLKFAIIYYVANLLIPIMSNYKNVYIDIFVVIFILFSILFIGKIRVWRIILPLILILIVQFVWYFLYGISEIPIIFAFYNSINFILPVLISFYLISNNYRKTIKLIIISTGILLFVTSVTSIIGLDEFPLASRALATGSANDGFSTLYSAMNIGGFNIVYMIPVITPMFFPLLNKNKLQLIFLLILIIGFGIFVFKSQYTIASITFVVTILSIFIIKKYSFKKFVFLGFIPFILVSYFGPFLGDIIYSISNDLNDNIVLTERLNSLGDGLSGVKKNDDDQLDDRKGVYEISIKTISQSPFLGGLLSIPEGKSGGHSFVIDRLALFGIIGWLALIFLYGHILRLLYFPFVKLPYYGYMYWSFLISIFLSIFNTSANIFAIGLFVPIAAFYLQKKVYIFKNNQAKLCSINDYDIL